MDGAVLSSTSGLFSANVQAIPEPSTVVLVALSAVFFYLRRHRSV
jgi:hypothetical protein